MAKHRSSLEIAQDLRARAAKAEAKALRKALADNPQVKALQSEIDELKAEQRSYTVGKHEENGFAARITRKTREIEELQEKLDNMDQRVPEIESELQGLDSVMQDLCTSLSQDMNFEDLTQEG